MSKEQPTVSNCDEKPVCAVVPEIPKDDQDSCISASSLYLTGWHLHGTTIFMLVSLFVAQMDNYVTSTAILDITDELGGYEKSSWVFTAYLLTYCDFQLIWARFSDIITRKTRIMTCLLIFTGFSRACGASQTIMQLIMFRWVQGIGGCGIFALTQLVCFEMVPPAKWPLYMSLCSMTIAISLVVGPLIGGAIAEQASWRWIFLLNVPVGCAAFIGLFLVFPAKLPNEPANADGVGLSRTYLKRIDVVGSSLLIGVCILLATSLQQAGQGYAWTSSYVLPLLIVAPIFVVAFLTWEWYVTKRAVPEPVFPWRFGGSRVSVGMFLNSFLSGGTLLICTVQIPQRFMAVNGLSASQAAVRLLAFGKFMPFSTILATALMNKPRIPAAFIFLTGACLQVVGAILISRIPTGIEVHQPQYAYQVLLGLGVGFVTAATIMLVPFVMEKQDLAVGTAAITQFRVFGGLIGLAIAASISTPYIRKHLAISLTPEMATVVLHQTKYIALLSDNEREMVRKLFGVGFGLQMKLLIAIAAAQIPATALMWTTQVIETGT